MESIQTRIPAFLWDSLQDVMYQQDYDFLREVSHIIRVPVADLKRTILGMRGALTTIAVSNTTQWWDATLCPIMVRTESGMWRACGQLREAHGACCNHRSFLPSTTQKRPTDIYFTKIQVRHPFKYDGEIVWVNDVEDVFRESGEQIHGIKINRKTGIARIIEPLPLRVEQRT